MFSEHKMTTEYNGFVKIYFQKLLNSIIKIGDLDRDNLTILDYGAGYGMIKKIMSIKNKTVTVINYDIKPELSDTLDWHKENFNVVVANEVFYTFDKEDLEQLLVEFKQYNVNIEVIVGISKQSFIKNIGKIIFGQQGAHNSTKILPKEEITILSKHMDIIDHKSVWLLADIYRLCFKKEM